MTNQNMDRAAALLGAVRQAAGYLAGAPEAIHAEWIRAEKRVEVYRRALVAARKRAQEAERALVRAKRLQVRYEGEVVTQGAFNGLLHRMKRAEQERDELRAGVADLEGRVRGERDELVRELGRVRGERDDLRRERECVLAVLGGVDR